MGHCTRENWTPDVSVPSGNIQSYTHQSQTFKKKFNNTGPISLTKNKIIVLRSIGHSNSHHLMKNPVPLKQQHPSSKF